ncbi:haloacid dehalogenase type II [Wenxinia saemankumensis]|uniref:(S)-2-haloacid dehalogenase n=1 Tax=Wenxinia saemankumensis TaxID=1447782 RepID=A0A1M6D4P2_9RHOB|nr:haloacid dehalogenase type II [Wenxinia saemankumensis]SHI68064.1 2-haloacid dehalogenase [Wenxinia saemankumensis]
MEELTRGYLFDVFGTLVDWRSGIADEAARVFADRGIDADPHAFADHWRSLYDPAMAAVRDGARGFVPLDVLHAEMLEDTLDRFGIGGAFDGSARAALVRAWERLPPWPDVGEGLAVLGRHALLAPCSNGSIALISRLSRFAQFRWDAILGAEIARDYKPKAEVYRASCRALGVPPERVTMVAAHNGDLAAARAAGLRTAFVARPAEHGPGQRTDLAPEAEWDVVADRLADVAGTI